MFGATDPDVPEVLLAPAWLGELPLAVFLAAGVDFARFLGAGLEAVSSSSSSAAVVSATGADRLRGLTLSHSFAE